MNVRTIYRGKSITRCSNSDAPEKGDVGYISLQEQEEVIAPIRFFLEDVCMWEVYNHSVHPFKSTNKEILIVYLQTNSQSRYFHIIEDIDTFDLLMDEFNSDEKLKLE